MTETPPACTHVGELVNKTGLCPPGRTTHVPEGGARKSEGKAAFFLIYQVLGLWERPPVPPRGFQGPAGLQGEAGGPWHLSGPRTRAPCPAPARPGRSLDVAQPSPLGPLADCSLGACSKPRTAGPMPQCPHLPLPGHRLMGSEARGLTIWPPHQDQRVSQEKIHSLSNVSTPAPGDSHGETTVTPHDLLFPEHRGMRSESCWGHGAPGSGLDVRATRPSPVPSPGPGPTWHGHAPPELPHMVGGAAGPAGVAPHADWPSCLPALAGPQRRGWGSPLHAN